PAAAVRPAVVGLELRLVVEGIDMAGAALHAQEDDPLGLRREVGRLRAERVGLRVGGLRGLLVCEGREREVAEPGRGGLEQLATREHGKAPCVYGFGSLTDGTGTRRWRRTPG